MENFCRSWGEALDGYHFIPLTTAYHDNDEIQAGMAIQALEAELSRLDSWDIYWAGSDDFSQALEQNLLLAGARAERLFYPRRRVVKRRSTLHASG